MLCKVPFTGSYFKLSQKISCIGLTCLPVCAVCLTCLSVHERGVWTEEGNRQGTEDMLDLGKLPMNTVAKCKKASSLLLFLHLKKAGSHAPSQNILLSGL